MSEWLTRAIYLSCRQNNPAFDGRSYTRPRSVCSCVQICLLVLSILTVGCTVVLHRAYAGHAGCLDHAVEIAAARAGVLLPPLPADNSTIPDASNSTSSGNDTAVSVDDFIELASGNRFSSSVNLGLKLSNITAEEYDAAVQSGAVNATGERWALIELTSPCSNLSFGS
jgi:hypothetical protein